jgi:methyl-accepting chemotaxis protein
MTFIDAIITWFLPESRRHATPGTERQARVAVSTMLIIALAGVVFGTAYRFVFSNTPASVILLSCAAALVCIAFLFRKVGSFELSSSLTAITVIATIVGGAMFTNGGSVAPGAQVMAVLPLLVLLVGGPWRLAAMWMGAGILTLVVVCTLEMQGMSIPNYVPAQLAPVNATACNIGSILMFYTMVLVFQRGERDALRHLDTARQAAEGEAVRIERAGQEAAEAERNHLSARVADMLVAMERFAAGDLTVRLSETTNAPDSELGQLYSGFNRAVSAVGNTIGAVANATESTAAASEQIHASTTYLAIMAQQQETDTGRIVSSVQDVLDGVVRSADGAARVASVAAENGATARSGGEVVRGTVTKITEIAAIVTNSVDAVDRLGASGRRIRDVSNVIKQVASQTRLLALNAAIEAARAGAHGVGFAVVAEEVNRLSARTAEATQQIADLVQEVESETTSATRSMRASGAAVSESLQLAARAENALTGIVSGTQETAAMVSDIAAASTGQSAACRTISTDVETVGAAASDAVKQLTSVASAANELAERGRELRALVRKFTLPDGRGEWKGSVLPDQGPTMLNGQNTVQHTVQNERRDQMRLSRA